MMNCFKNIITFSVLFFVSTLYYTYAQTASEIITKNLEVTGGEINWNKLNTVRIKGTATLGVEDKYNIEIIQKRPNLTKSTMVIDGKKVVLEGYDGKNGYKTNFTTGKKEIIKNYKPETFDSDLLSYESKGFSVELKGKEKVEGKECFKILLKKNSNETTYYFDTSSYYLIKEVRKEETIVYSNYKKMDKYYMAYKIESTSTTKDSDFVLNITSIEINKVIENKEFKY